MAGAALAALTACGRPRRELPVRLVDSPAPAAVSDQLAALEDSYTAKVGFYGVNLASNRTLARRSPNPTWKRRCWTR